MFITFTISFFRFIFTYLTIFMLQFFSNFIFWHYNHVYGIWLTFKFILCLENLSNSLSNHNNWSGNSWAFYMYTISQILSFISSFPVLVSINKSFPSISCLTVLAKISHIMLKRNDDYGYLCDLVLFCSQMEKYSTLHH